MRNKLVIKFAYNLYAKRIPLKNTKHLKTRSIKGTMFCKCKECVHARNISSSAFYSHTSDFPCAATEIVVNRRRPCLYNESQILYATTGKRRFPAAVRAVLRTAFETTYVSVDSGQYLSVCAFSPEAPHFGHL